MQTTLQGSPVVRRHVHCWESPAIERAPRAAGGMAIFDSVTTAGKAKAAAALVKLSQQLGAPGIGALARVKLIKEVQRLVAELGGAVSKLTKAQQTALEALKAIGAGKRDGEGIGALVNAMSDCMDAFDGDHDLPELVKAGNAAVARWAALEMEENKYE